MKKPKHDDTQIAEMAIIGYRSELDKINGQITQLQGRLGQSETGAGGAQTRKRHIISAAGRKRISDAQKRRWKAAREKK